MNRAPTRLHGRAEVPWSPRGHCDHLCRRLSIMRCPTLSRGLGSRVDGGWGVADIKALIGPPGHGTARMKSLSRRKVDDAGGRKPGEKPAKDGPGFQVDGPRAWGWHLSVADAEARGQAGMSAKRSAARAGGGRGGLRKRTSVGSRRWARIRRITRGSSMVAIRRIRPPDAAVARAGAETSRLAEGLGTLAGHCVTAASQTLPGLKSARGPAPTFD